MRAGGRPGGTEMTYEWTAGDDRDCGTQRLVSQTVGRPFVAEGGFGLERKTGGACPAWPLNNNNNNNNSFLFTAIVTNL